MGRVHIGCACAYSGFTSTGAKYDGAHYNASDATQPFIDLHIQSTLLTVDTAYHGQLSTVDSQQCTLHFGAKTLLTIDISLNCGPWTPFHGTKVHFLSLLWTVHKYFFSNFSFLHFIFSYFYNF